MNARYKVIILGGGFAGVSALRHLFRYAGGTVSGGDVLLIDRKDNFEFLPLLPDLISGKITPDSASRNLKDLCTRKGAAFLRAEVTGIDPEKTIVTTDKGVLKYEKLIICLGAEPDFFGNSELQKKCLRLYGCGEAVNVAREALEKAEDTAEFNIIVVGGGYTGLETATNIHRLLKTAHRSFKITILEKAPDILMMAPRWIRKKCEEELRGTGIDVRKGTSLTGMDGRVAVLDTGERIENSLCVWTAGVRSSAVLDGTGFDKDRTRLVVSSCLAPVTGGIAAENIFIAGDAASYRGLPGERPLRMAVMFAMGQGRVAAHNVVNSFRGRKKVSYRAVDLGYLVPLATGKAPGVVMGVPVPGFLGYILHYLMCFYRTPFICKKAMLRDILIYPGFSGLGPGKGHKREKEI